MRNEKRNQYLSLKFVIMRYIQLKSSVGRAKLRSMVRMLYRQRILVHLFIRILFQKPVVLWALAAGSTSGATVKLQKEMENIKRRNEVPSHLEYSIN